MDEIIYQKTRKLFLQRAGILRKMAITDTPDAALEWMYTQHALAALRRAYWKQPEVAPRPAVIIPEFERPMPTDDVTAMGKDNPFGFDMSDEIEVPDDPPPPPVEVVLVPPDDVLPPEVKDEILVLANDRPMVSVPLVSNPFAIDFDE